MPDPTLSEMIDVLREHYALSNVDYIRDINNDFDVAQAIYWFCADYHSGQTSNLYSVLCGSKYRPGCLEYSAALDNEYYDILCENFAK